MSVNRIIANNTNAIREAVLTATAQRPSTDIRLVSQSRKGRGRMTLTGPYAGAADSDIDVEIVAGAAGAPRASAPVIAGVGNGTLSVLSIDVGAVPETLTFTLLDAGDPAEAAVLDFFGTTLAAKVAGAAGNALELTVTRNLVATDLPYALISPISAGTSELDGPEWDFGAAAATGGGVPAAAPRIRFAGFPQVHRTWKVWSDGRWVYRLDPAPAWDVPADTRVEAIAGDYTLTLTDGVAPEVYQAVTIYDFLAQVQARSALVEVRGAVAKDSAPGGMGITDIPLRTDAHALPVTAQLRNATAPRLEVISVVPAAPTENITVTYLGRGAGTVEAWSVSGGVSGALPNASTSQDYAAGPVSFRIPTPSATQVATARISAVVSLVGRADDEGLPAICFKPLVLGAQASDKSVTYTWRKRPPADCVCEDMPALKISEACLGLAQGGTEMALDAEYQSRLEALYQWRRDFVDSQIATATAHGVAIADGDMDYCDAAVRILGEALGETYTVAAARTEWDAALTELQGDFTNLAGVRSAGALTFGASGTQVGGQFVNPVNGHVYRLDSVVVDTSNVWKYIAQATNVLPYNDAAWPTSGGSADVGYDGVSDQAITVTDLGAVQDLYPRPAQTQIDNLVRRYAARMDYVRVLAGIVPKSSASGAGGDACWRDQPDATHWWVDESGEYLPVFNNVPYVSVSRDAEGKIYSTQEFGLGLVTPCEHRIKEGDKFTVTIRGAGGGAFAEGDRFVIPVVAAQAIPFAGGEDGDPTQTWTARGSVSGALPDWLFDPSAPAPYTDGPAEVALAPGGIPFEVGDAIRFAIEGGRLRWRRGGGAWTEGDLYAAHALGDGLTLQAVAGAAPSFLPVDAWSFRAYATFGLDRLRQPRVRDAFAWDGAAVVLDADLGGVQPIELMMLALHTLPPTATVLIEGGDAAPGEWSASPALVAGPIVAVLEERTARYLRVTVAGAGAGAEIGWLWAGVAWMPTVGASDLTQVRQYGLARGAGLNPGALYRGRGTGGRWAWSIDQGGALAPAIADALAALIDHVAEQGLEPVCLLPDYREPARASLAVIDADEVTFSDDLAWQHSGNRMVSVELPFRAILS